MNHKEKELFMELAGFKTASHDRLCELVGTAATPKFFVIFSLIECRVYHTVCLKKIKCLAVLTESFVIH